MVVAGDLLFDAVDLVFVNVGVIGNKSELARFDTDGVSDEITKGGVLNDIKRETEWHIRGTRGDEEIEVTIHEVPLGVPDTGREGGGLKPFILPERKDHTAITGVLF